MRRRYAVAAFALCAAIVPAAPARAEAEAAEAYRVPVAVSLPHFTPPLRRPPTRLALYAVQLADALSTAAALRRAGRYEANPAMRPFARGGVPTLVVGFALGDLARDHLFRHRPVLRDSLDAVQGLLNVDGLVTTARSARAGR